MFTEYYKFLMLFQSYGEPNKSNYICVYDSSLYSEDKTNKEETQEEEEADEESGDEKQLPVSGTMTEED